jgi:class 3 adenylate cyclase/tetratricopeptide (TPR) repeat protein
MRWPAPGCAREAVWAALQARRVNALTSGLVGKVRNTALMAVCTECSFSLPGGARFCPSCAAPVAAESAAKERKLVTLLFADLVGSTALGDSLDAEHTRDLLDRFYDAMSAEIAIGGGTIEKFIGDAVVAVFGAPTAREDHAERALDTALELRRRLRKEFGDQLALRIGVNSGEVVVGRPRDGSSFVTGDAVNVAARLEQAAAPGQILVGERTAAAVGGAFEFGRASTIQAKGKPEGVRCRELVRMVSRMRPRRSLGATTTFVGRISELEWLDRELALCESERKPHLVSLVGEAGLGKTSLVREFHSRLPDKVLYRLGRCVPYGRGGTYSPLAEVLLDQLGLGGDDVIRSDDERLTGREILGLTLGLDVAGELDPRSASAALRREWARLLTETAAHSTVVLVLEDLHWASEPLVELIDHLLAEVDGPLLVLVTTRTYQAELRSTAASATLRALTEPEAAQLLQTILGSPLPRPALDFLVERSGGNPFFLEELLATLIDQKMLEEDGEGWQLRAFPAASLIPDSLQAVLAARIDLLDAGQKTALQAASVIGRNFSTSALEALVETSSAQLITLVERGFLRTGEHQSQMVFKHALTWEVAYGSIPKARRARLHAVVAAWVAETAVRKDDHAPILAFHYGQAVDPEFASLAWRGEEAELDRLTVEAVQWLRRAAQLAIGRHDIVAALALLRRAVKLAPDDGTLWRAIGEAHLLAFDGEGYWEAMLRAVELCSDDDLLADLYADLAFSSTIRGAMWKKGPDIALVQAWLAKAFELARPKSGALTRALITRAFHHDDAEAADEAVVMAGLLDDVELQSHGLHAHIAIAQLSGDYEGARKWARRRLELATRITDPDHLALIHWSSATAELAAGDLRSAEKHAWRHDAIAGQLSPHHAIHALGCLFSVGAGAGRWEAIRRLQARTERTVLENTGTPCALNARNLLICATACARLGFGVDARRLEEEARGLGLDAYALWLDPVYAHLAFLRSDLDQVHTLLEGSEKWVLPSYDHVYGAAARLDMLIAVGRHKEAESFATTLSATGGYLEPFGLRALGLTRRDVALLSRSIDRFDAIGLKWHADDTRRMAIAAGLPAEDTGREAPDNGA